MGNTKRTKHSKHAIGSGGKREGSGKKKGSGFKSGFATKTVTFFLPIVFYDALMKLIKSFILAFSEGKSRLKTPSPESEDKLRRVSRFGYKKKIDYSGAVFKIPVFENPSDELELKLKARDLIDEFVASGKGISEI